MKRLGPLLTSVQNPTVKHLVKLRQRRERDRQQRFLIDGARAVRLALANAIAVEAIYVAAGLIEVQADLLKQAEAAGVFLQPVSATVFRKIGYGDHPDGLLGVARQPVTSLQRLPRPQTPLYLIAEGLEKPGNLGAILRSADAAGATGCIFCDSQTDLWNPNVIRASLGACYGPCRHRDSNRYPALATSYPSAYFRRHPYGSTKLYCNRYVWPLCSYSWCRTFRPNPCLAR